MTTMCWTIGVVAVGSTTDGLVALDEVMPITAAAVATSAAHSPEESLAQGILPSQSSCGWRADAPPSTHQTAQRHHLDIGRSAHVEALVTNLLPSCIRGVGRGAPDGRSDGAQQRRGAGPIRPGAGAPRSVRGLLGDP